MSKKGSSAVKALYFGLVMIGFLAVVWGSISSNLFTSIKRFISFQPKPRMISARLEPKPSLSLREPKYLIAFGVRPISTSTVAPADWECEAGYLGKKNVRY